MVPFFVKVQLALIWKHFSTQSTTILWISWQQICNFLSFLGQSWIFFFSDLFTIGMRSPWHPFWKLTLPNVHLLTILHSFLVIASPCCNAGEKFTTKLTIKSHVWQADKDFVFYESLHFAYFGLTIFLYQKEIFNNCTSHTLRCPAFNCLLQKNKCSPHLGYYMV